MIMLQRFITQVQRKHELRRKRIAEKLWQRREKLNRPGNQSTDWESAGKIAHNPIRMMLFDLNSPLIWMEKNWFEPADGWLTQAAFFDIINRFSPALEAIGFLLIPLVLYIATQRFEEQRDARESERLQQQAIEDYIEQITEVLLNTNGELRADENERIRNVLTAATITQLRDPNLDGIRKGQIIEFLSQTKLVQGEPQKSERQADERQAEPIVSLFRASLSGADLSFADLNHTDLSGAYLNNAYLSGANLSHTDLSGAYLNRTNLSNADLSNADLRHIDLSFSYLDFADLSYTLLIKTDLRESKNLTSEQLNGDEQPYICGVALPSNITDTDPNRDCDDPNLPKIFIKRYDYTPEEAQQIIKEARNKQWD